MTQCSSRAWPRAVLAVLTSALAACGGGGSATTDPPVTPAEIDYPNSIVVGASAPQALVYHPAVGAMPAMVSAGSASGLLAAGNTAVLAEHVEATLPGLRVVCVSGRGESTGVISAINLGVIAESAAVLLDARWGATDAGLAWAGAVTRGKGWLGWENCGVKPEGAPSPSSRLVPAADGGYAEDIFDGNPGTTFNTISTTATAASVAAMLSAAGRLAPDDPLRPLQLTLRAYADNSGHTVFVETGTPVPGAPAAARGFVALYVAEP